MVSSSVRAERVGPSVTDWVVAALHGRGRVDVDKIDLAEISLPDDRELSPGGGPRTVVSSRIARAEAFVFVTPEFNHSYPASLKRLLDWHTVEWKLKPATVIAYGITGGHAAIEHLRGVLVELQLVTARRCVGLRAPWNDLDDVGRYVPSPAAARYLDASLAELEWWSDVLADARARRPFPD